MVYINKGEHKNPHGLPHEQSMGLIEIDHTLYSHMNTESTTFSALEKLEYIYAHLQDNEKIHKSDPGTVIQVPDNIYIHISTMILNMVYLKTLLIATI